MEIIKSISGEKCDACNNDRRKHNLSHTIVMLSVPGEGKYDPPVYTVRLCKKHALEMVVGVIRSIADDIYAWGRTEYIPLLRSIMTHAQKNSMLVREKDY